MRQSLSERAHPSTYRAAPVTGAALAAAAALVPAVAGLVDQSGGQALVDHALAMYTPHGEDASAGLLYGLVYAIAAANVLLWLLVVRSAHTGSRWAAAYAVTAVLVGAGMAAALVGSREYGEQIFPTLWGLLALLSPIVGVLAVVHLARRKER